MRVKLVIVGGEAKVDHVWLRLPAVIGRGREARLTLPHPLVSRSHCELFEENGRLRVRDLGSLNGTYVADKRVSEAAVPNGELLTVGTMTFRVSCEESPAEGDSDDAPANDATKPTASDIGFVRSAPQHASETSDFPMEENARQNEEQSIERETTWQPGSAAANSDDDFRTFLNGF